MPVSTITTSDLVTLSQVKSFLVITDSTQDTRLAAAITAASAAIRSYTGRDMSSSSSPSPGTITYGYDRSGWLDIDDCTAITAVTLDGSALTLNQTYTPGPDRGLTTPDGGNVYTWLELVPGINMSPEMGFAWNLDMLYLYGLGFQQYSAVAVTATFGWATVPADVVQAALWTVAEFAASPPEGFTHLGIDSYNVSQAAGAQQRAIPDRARDLLAPYRSFV